MGVVVNQRYFVHEDPMGRMIVLWLDATDKDSLKVTIDDGVENIVSLPGQNYL